MGFAVLPKASCGSYDTWLGDETQPSFQEQLRTAIDAALSECLADYDAFLAPMARARCVYKPGEFPGLYTTGYEKARSVQEEVYQKGNAPCQSFDDLSGGIKTDEKRMAEIAVLETHIIKYSKTRDTYTAYRKAGYSKTFFAARESENILHKAASFPLCRLRGLNMPSLLPTVFIAPQGCAASSGMELIGGSSYSPTSSFAKQDGQSVYCFALPATTFSHPLRTSADVNRYLQLTSALAIAIITLLHNAVTELR